MKKLWVLLCLAMVLSLVGCAKPKEETPKETRAKSVIYLYPQQEEQARVEIRLDGEMTHSYPYYGSGWEVTAAPDGTLTDRATGRTHYSLCREGVSQKTWEFTTGFVVPGELTAEFLEEALRQQGLTDRESNEFIQYWLPLMEGNPYNMISFQQENYSQIAKLEIQPEPDSILRVFMVFKPLKSIKSIELQELENVERSGFTVVEWGGVMVE